MLGPQEACHLVTVCDTTFWCDYPGESVSNIYRGEQSGSSTSSEPPEPKSAINFRHRHLRPYRDFQSCRLERSTTPVWATVRGSGITLSRSICFQAILQIRLSPAIS